MADNEHFNSGDTVITPDNVQASKQRYDAIQAVRKGQATPEQYKLVEDTDRVMKEAMQKRKR